MSNYYTIEEKYLEAIEEIYYREAPKGLQLLREILDSDPLHARAHYQLGILYFYALKDYQAAGFHFKTCVQLEPAFPDVYVHYLGLVIFLNMTKQVNDIVQQALKVPGVNAFEIFELAGQFHEKNKSWKKARKAYEEALGEATHKSQKTAIEESLARIKEKKQRGKAYQYVLSG